MKATRHVFLLSGVIKAASERGNAVEPTILEALNGVQLQRRVTMTPRYQWDAVPNENGDHTDDELVDRLRVKKRGDDLAAPHQPDILARPRSKATHEWPDGIVHELHAWRGVRWRMAGENDAPTL